MSHGINLIFMCGRGHEVHVSYVLVLLALFPEAYHLIPKRLLDFLFEFAAIDLFHGESTPLLHYYVPVFSCRSNNLNLKTILVLRYEIVKIQIRPSVCAKRGSNRLTPLHM